MPSHRFRIVNVFTRDRGALSGNPLCVFEDAASFDTATMQALARQFNLSETTFILPSTGGTARVRIFTPAYELPFAGHPTLGTAHVCRSLGLGGDALRLELPAGVIPVTAAGDRWTLLAPVPSWRELGLPRATLARALSLEESDIGERPLWVKAGKEQLVVPLADEDAVRRASPRAAEFDRIRSEDGQCMAYVFALAGSGRAAARFFFPQDGGMIEDPATGSAAANLGGWCVAMGQTLPVRLEIAQGDMVNRSSTLFLEVGAAGDIRVGGDVVELGRGAISLD